MLRLYKRSDGALVKVRHRIPIVLSKTTGNRNHTDYD